MADTNYPPLVSLTDSAAKYAGKLLEKADINPPPGGIRFRIKAGGCSGLVCEHVLEEVDDKNDLIVISNGVRILVDPKSATVLQGTTVDHSGDLLEKPFTFENSRFKSACGCNVSFEI